MLSAAQQGWGKIEASDSPTAAMYSRAEEIAKRVALILAANLISDPAELDSRPPKPISALLTGAACELVDWSIGMGCGLIRQYATDSPHGQMVKLVLESFTKVATKARADKARPEPGVPAWMVRKNHQNIDGPKFDGIVRQLIETRQLVDVTPPARRGQLLCPVHLLGEGR